MSFGDGDGKFVFVDCWDARQRLVNIDLKT